MDTAEIHWDYEWEDRAFCQKCSVDRPFTIASQHGEESAWCEKCGWEDYAWGTYEDSDPDEEYEEACMNSDGGGWY